jgi:NAD(P)-dependent dehydrogenase (short-subunit alcohol dehydrogenase family)
VRFKNRIVLVTGASRNTGLEIAARFAAEAATVYINGSTAESVRGAMDELRSRGYEQIVEATADLRDSTAVQAVFSDIRTRYGRLDVLVNNAVEQACGYSFEDMPVELFDQVIRVNLIGLFHVAREAARIMIAQGGGAIVNVGSNVSMRAIRKRAAYCASKGGVDALTRAMAVDLGHYGIRVNTVAPGYIHTERWDRLPKQDAQRRRANIPLGKEATVGDIADAVLFLASDQAANIHGARLVVDGGCSAQHMPFDADV